LRGSDLPYIEFGNSDDLKLGQWVLAVGNPLNLTSTVTAGIVSAKARGLNVFQDREMAITSFIQTDAAVNRGNSGGALVNLRGELVGIPTLIISPTAAYSGNSFAVPVSLVQKVVEDIREFGEVQRAVMGVQIRDMNAQYLPASRILTVLKEYMWQAQLMVGQLRMLA
jgi:serine protease Do